MTDADRLILPVNHTSIGKLLCEPGMTMVHQSSLLCVLKCASPEPHAPWRKEASGWTRMFERTYVAPLSSDTERGQLVSAFFDWLGDRYGLEMEPARNQACYEFLFARAQACRNQSACSALLDVGCGPGTILSTRINGLVSTIRGFDISQVARRAAKVVGLEVMTEEQFLSGKKSFDIALSAYVMHYGCDMDQTLRAVSRHLVHGGVWSMNFHKGINLSLFMARLPGTGLNLAAEPQDSHFGISVAVIA